MFALIKLFFVTSWYLPPLSHTVLSVGQFSLKFNLCTCFDGVMVSVLASGVVDRGFEHPSGKPKDYKIGICCFSAKHAALRRKSKDWLARNQNNVTEWGDMSFRGLLIQ